ncbi:Exocyst complex component exo84 [Lecanosticta acicola]|uniref:Exocyst complex component EXO84 n=1 Tax=Lecanosticta acicola TaxID=111012 RepID=A0AAI8YU58_9PEZI|nr:Exocyst complex component exo84 [Lecanosticta acicola]
MSESKGISLRRKKTTAARPTISAPTQFREGSNGPSRSNSEWTVATQDSGATSRDRSRGRADQTSDLVKRRYSTRFTGGPAQDGAPPSMPAMPTLPPQFVGAGGSGPGMRPPPSRDGDSKSRDRGQGTLKVDIRALKDPNLQVDKYVQSILSDATESDITAYQRDLQNVKAHTDADLQHNVYQNRTQFVKISKEADKLKSEMRTLRTLMSELTGALGHATSAAGADINTTSTLSLADRKRANRSSVANLEAMWSTHLQTLWKRVEGSQKYLPALPGRHIILESQRWVELNAATWKPRRRVALVLLNDHLLVATEKKRAVDAAPAGQGNRMSMYNPGGQSQTTLVADRCWPLHDVSLADISTRSSTSMGQSTSKENKAISNAINVRAGNESFTYATSDSADKAGLIVAFRKAQEDQRKQLAAEHAGREKKLDELAAFTGRDPRSLKKAAAAGNEQQGEDGKLGGLSRSNSVLVDADGRPQSIRWVESQIDGLDIDIALQRFEEAVARVESLRKMARGIKGNATAQEIILVKVNERASRLANNVARQLGYASGGAERTKENVSWLLRLGFEQLARNTYLSSRTETIRMRTRQLPFTGALEPYLHALSYTTFTLLVHTFRTFNQSFPASSGSAVVRWAKERVDDFNAALHRQLGTVDRDSDVWNSCIQIIEEQALALGEVGVDFKGLVAKDLTGSAGAATNGAREPVGLGVST